MRISDWSSDVCSSDIRAKMMTHYPTPEHARLAAEGMYRPDMESDACGVGLVAATDGKASRRVVEAAIQALRAVWHRGAVDADGIGRAHVRTPDTYVTLVCRIPHGKKKIIHL